MKDRSDRQERLYEALNHLVEPVTGQDLSSLLGVTRQVIVHDIALLRAQGVGIVSTPRGYWIPPKGDPSADTYVLSVLHSPELTGTELLTLVDYGIKILDVVVEHPIYGELRGSLHLASRRDVNLFLNQVTQSGAGLLSSLTEGYHLHTVESPTEEQLTEAVAELKRLGIQVFD